MKCFNKSSNQCKNWNIQHKGGYVACHLHANDPTNLNYSALCLHKFNIFFFGPIFLIALTIQIVSKWRIF